MTITNQNKRVEQVGDGANKNFTFNFEVTDTSELKVIQHDTLLGADATLVEGTDYAAAIVGSGGTVTIDAGRDAPLATDYIVMLLRVPLTQDLSLEAGSGMDPPSVEGALDKLLQNLKWTLDLAQRAMGLTEGSPTGTGVMDAQTSRIINVKDPVDVTDATNKQWVAAEILNAADGTFTGTVTAAGAALVAAADHDAQGALVSYLPAHTGGTSRTMTNKLSEIRSVKDFGAVGDGTTDDLLAIQAALDSFGMDEGGTLYFPEGRYRITAGLTHGEELSIIGVGAGNSNPPVGDNGSMILMDSEDEDALTYSGIRAFSITGIGFAPASGVTRDADTVFINTGTVHATGVPQYPVTIDNCTFLLGDRAIEYRDAKNLRIQNCTFWAQAASAVISISAGSFGALGRVWIENNLFDPLSTGTGVEIQDSEHADTIITGNIFIGGANGVAVNLDEDTQSIDISHNNFVDQAVRAINIDQNTVARVIQNVLVSGNMIRSTIAAALTQILVAPGDATTWIKNLQVSDNIINTDMDGATAMLGIFAGSNIIISNNILDNSSNTDAAIVTGIDCRLNAGVASITDNLIRNMGTNGLRFGILGTGCRVSDMQNEMTLAEVLSQFTNATNGSMAAASDVTVGADGTAMFTPGVGGGSGSVGVKTGATWRWM